MSFVAFSLFAKVKLSYVSVSAVLSYLGFLVEYNLSVNMINNDISAIRAMSIVLDLLYGSWEHPKGRYFVKSLKLHRPMALVKRNITDINTLKCHLFPDAEVYKYVLLAVFFGFFHLSHLGPHAIVEFDSSRHFTGGSIF